MSEKKYNVKKSGKIMGPLKREEVDQMLIEGRLEGEEQYQELPSKSWKPLSMLLDKENENTLFLKIENIKEKLIQEQEEKLDSIDEELREKNIEFRTNKERVKREETIVGKGQGDILDAGKKVDDFSKTQIRQSKDSNNIEKTVVRPLSEEEKRELQQLKEKPKEKEVQKEKESETKTTKKEAPVVNNDVTSFEEETIVASLRGIKRKIISEVKASEVAIVEEKNKSREVEKDAEIEGVDKKSRGGKKKKSFLYMAIVAIVLVFVLMEIINEGSNKEKTLNPIAPKIIFPIKLQFKEPERSKELELKGDGYYQKEGYENIFNASRLYARSLGYNFDNRAVLGKLILSYSELYRDSTKAYRDSEVIMKLIKIAERKIPNDINYVMGGAIFFSHINRHLSAINLIERFLKINKVLSIKLIKHYMLSSLEVGMETEAQKAFEQLSSLKEMNIDAFLGVAEYHMRKGDYDQAEMIFRTASKKYPASVELLINYCKVLLHRKDFSKLRILLAGIKDVSFSRSIYFYSQYLKYMGVILAIEKKGDEALRFFKKIIKYYGR